VIAATVDTSLAEHANRFAVHHDTWEDVAKAWASLSEPLFLALVIAVIGAGLLLRRRGLLSAGILAGLSAGVALAIGHVVSVVVDRQRPFVADHNIHPFVHHAADASFPSDHTTAAFAIAAALVLRLGARWIPVLVAAAALAVARVMIGLHYPGDVLAGAVIGTLAAMAVCAVAPRLWDRLPERARMRTAPSATR
jgi:undecaprenyl-diphosphatase